ncbi:MULTISPECIES: ABC transporter permease [Acidobacterium]|uniref:Putative transporter n=1 Tax=Acidobacterium capsulatum (strain ATCC 51196 / DSM 11244 / BCRC 80197 / JCM 7670 / NBRC 15755 / NCIMB 13165 / 161) TaxID=240015 RepID=C1F7L0_ACIC5|nr:MULTISPECIES: ABC transporter permease [Acidobacterium]ACO31709.1 putative transporter [Acidobacterium capsulatum ATCC 51196]HCT59631.1 ABC transporter permease [Acidobacterium sp.]
MHSILLIAKREYIERVRSKVFRITTILVPLGLLVMIGAIALLSKKATGLNHIVIASNSPALAATMQDQLKNGEHPPASIQVVAPATEADRARLTAEISSNQVDGVLWLTLPSGATKPTATYYTRSSSDVLAEARLESALGRAAVREQLVQKGMAANEARDLVKPIDISMLQVKHGVAVKTDATRSYFGIYALVMVLYVSVLFYGTDVARSVTEEKGTRIIEVLLSSAPADSLMMGKLLGVGAAALTQVAIWVFLTIAVSGSGLAAQIGMHGLSSLGINATELIFFLVFFLLGFFFYSALSAALGSTANSSQEVQQFAFIIIAPLVIAVFMMSYVITNPNAPLSVVMSLIPPFTPIIMYLRICSQMPPVWQLALSIALMLASIWAMVWLAARIYRIGILMYGKRPNIPEILRWLRYS